uniref:hypothetical protein n=1 Tax=Paractinoplanes polyasparticus TaxID=2856853 RepID=UPI001C851E1D|nr:hypothetical protein [Actinoplanes polyasparticus]
MTTTLTATETFTRRFWVRIGAVGLLAWPVTHFAGFVTGPPGSDHAPAIFRTHATQVQVSGVLLHWNAIIIVPVMLALAYLLHDRMPRLAAIAGLLGALGAINGSGLLMADFYDLALAQSLPDAQATAITELAYGYSGVTFGFLLPAFLLHPALLALVIGLVKAGRAWWWQPVLLVIGLALPFLTADRPMLVQASGALFIGAALYPLGLRMLRRTA